MKFLIAGLGSIGRRHFRNLIALGERDIVLLRTRKATLPDDELAGYSVETDLHDALKKHKPDAIIVFKDKISWVNILGIFVCLAVLVMLNWKM